MGLHAGAFGEDLNSDAGDWVPEQRGRGEGNWIEMKVRKIKSKEYGR